MRTENDQCFTVNLDFCAKHTSCLTPSRRFLTGFQLDSLETAEVALRLDSRADPVTDIKLRHCHAGTVANEAGMLIVAEDQGTAGIFASELFIK